MQNAEKKTFSDDYRQALEKLEDAILKTLNEEGTLTDEIVDDFAGVPFGAFVFSETTVLDALNNLKKQGRATFYTRRFGKTTAQIWQATDKTNAFLGSIWD